MNSSVLLWDLLFGSIGTGYFIYGKKQRQMAPMICGVGLMTYPLLVEGTFAMVAIGVALMALPFFVRR